MTLAGLTRAYLIGALLAGAALTPLLMGCAAVKAVDFFAYRQVPPECVSMERWGYAGRSDKKWYHCPVRPHVIESVVYAGGFARTTIWAGQAGPETFVSTIVCPSGVPEFDSTEEVGCWQKYWGLKMDGSIYLELIANGIKDINPYVFADEEQRSWRYRKKSWRCKLEDMAGC